jgi:deferrochelatase/peroxidase EfeB
MGGKEMSASAVDFSDIQGLVRFGYNALSEASFLLLKVRDARAACAWLSAAPITTAVELSQAPKTALQVAFTREGLQALGVEDHVLAGFSDEFLSGMTGQESRSRRLGDVGANSPQYWQWGGWGNEPHVLVMLYAQPGQLESWTQTIQGGEWDRAFEVSDSLPTSNLFGAEPFGFKDGVSQPTLDWKRQRAPDGDQLEYGNLLTLGEFLLGYPNEYGKYTQRPLLDGDAPASSVLPFAEDAPGRRDLGRNGAYIVLRQLRQDVRGFWRFLDRQTGANPQARQTLADSMVGRRANGDPLLPTATLAIEGIDPKAAAQNQFTYDSDSDGVRCPFGAHIRRANPRNGDLPPGSTGLFARLLHTLGFGNPRFRDDVIAATRFHRLLRRGREYGPALTQEQAVADGPDTGEHGIHFLCIVANILRQFEFVQNAWVMATKFDAMTEESDPLLGNRDGVPGCPFTNTFSIPRETGLRTRIMDVPQFVTVRGGAYFFLPSLSALRYLAAIGTTLGQHHFEEIRNGDTQRPQ